MPDGKMALAGTGLRAPRFFHPKVYAYDSGTGLTIVSASGNLTEGGLIKNIEQFLTWSGGIEEPEAVEFERWWASRWKNADPAHPEFIAAYAEARPKIQPPSGVRGAKPGPIEEPEPAPTDLKGARSMWVEATRTLEGGSRNQLELMLTAHHFFYPDVDRPPRDEGRSLEFVDAAGNLYDNPDRIVHFNGPPFMPKGNWMWRLRLPTEREGLEGYQQGGVAIRFERTDSPNRYLIEFAELESSQAAQWDAASNKIAVLPGPPPKRMGWA